MRIFTIFITIFFLFSLSTIAQDSSKYCYKNIDSDEFNLLIETKDIILLDVRTIREFKKGRIINSQLAPEKESLTLLLKHVDKSDTILLYCKEGIRSATAAEFLCEEKYYTNVYNLEEGLIKWEKDGYSIDKSEIIDNISEK